MLLIASTMVVIVHILGSALNLPYIPQSPLRRTLSPLCCLLCLPCWSTAKPLGGSPKSRSTLRLQNLHHRSIRVHNWGGSTFWILSLRVQVPTIRYLPTTIITIPSMETLNTLWLVTLDPQGFGGLRGPSSPTTSSMSCTFRPSFSSTTLATGFLG